MTLIGALSPSRICSIEHDIVDASVHLSYKNTTHRMKLVRLKHAHNMHEATHVLGLALIHNIIHTHAHDIYYAWLTDSRCALKIPDLYAI